MILETLSACPICQSTSFAPFISAKDYTVSQQEFNIVTCQNCSFRFTNPRPGINNIQAYYKSEKYISHTVGSKSIIDRLYRLLRTYTLKWKYELINEFSDEKTLLDYGCGTGNFLSYVQHKGWNVTGVEPAQEARAIAKQKATIYEQLETIEQKYSIVTLWHVLEHVHNLTTTLQELKKKLTRSGTIFIAVPNYKSADAQLYKQHWAAYDVPRHLWHFDKGVMNNILMQTGFEVKKIIPMKLDAYYVALLSEGYKNPHTMQLLNYINALKNGWLSNHQAKETGEYSSLIYIAQHT
ncbi:MAG: class I SAM-dependent methyltransferase [Cyclobacteriaceae bacterium]|nr:class I SAM-dependent methyltransferase [Cyclobacteriaceae bacterium]